MAIKNEIFDYINIGISGLILIYYIILLLRVIKKDNRELEFNRIWRTRALMILLCIFYAIFACFSNITIFPKFFKKKSQRAIACNASAFLQNGLCLPFYISIVISLARIATTSETLSSENPNKQIMKKMIKYSILPLILCIGTTVSSMIKYEVRGLRAYIPDEDSCTTPTISAGIVFLFGVIGFFIMLKTFDIFNKTGLNRIHLKRVYHFPTMLLPFLFSIIVSGVEEFFSNWIFIIAQTASILLAHIGFIIYNFNLIQKPLKEASIDKIYRGSITMRHHAFLNNRPDVVPINVEENSPENQVESTL